MPRDLSTFSLIEEKNAVWKCFASDERAAINKYAQSDECMTIINPEQVEYTSGEELEGILRRFNA